MKRYAQAINQLGDLAQSLRIQRGLGYNVHHTAYGQVIKLDRVSGGEDGEDGSTIQRFQVRALENDWLECRKLKDNGELDDADTTTYYVAKPVQLRVSTLGGTTNTALGYTFTISFPTAGDYGNTRRLTNTSDNSRFINEVLFPAYEVGSEIYACEPEDKTGVLRNEVRLTWLDLNVDARCYRPKYQRVAVCVQEGGQTVTRYMYVAGGPIQA
jgi:hypothetical protein